MELLELKLIFADLDIDLDDRIYTYHLYLIIS